MAIEYTWKITGLKTKTDDVFSNAVVQSYWQKIGTDEQGNTGTFSGATPFTPDPTDSSGPFIPFEQLTEQDVIEWVKTVVVGEYEQHVDGKILEQINSKKTPTIEASMPWVVQSSTSTAP